ncbi:MAG TPA: hypothetical protein V6D17_05270 [Candidatus Obscuribacterales bacterium]
MNFERAETNLELRTNDASNVMFSEVHDSLKTDADARDACIRFRPPAGCTSPVDGQFVFDDPYQPGKGRLDLASVAAGESVEIGRDLALRGSEDNENASYSYTINAGHSGPFRLDLAASSPDTDWGWAGAECGVLSVFVDGAYTADVVLWKGSETSNYSVALGELSRGEHEITLQYNDAKSPFSAYGADIAIAAISSVSFASKEDAWAERYAPILYGRNGLENNHTDTPLGMYHEIKQMPDGTTVIEYGVVFTHEDDGSARNGPLQQARWGRMSDMETIYSVTLDSHGNLLHSEYQGPGHAWPSFKGETEGDHAILYTATGNNMVTDGSRHSDRIPVDGGQSLRFRLTLDHELPQDLPREELMRLNSAWFEVQTKELYREGRIDQDGSQDGSIAKPDDSIVTAIASQFEEVGLADPREYLYVQLKTEISDQQTVVVRVTLEDGRTYDQVLGRDGISIERDGADDNNKIWMQTAVLLPSDVDHSDVASVEAWSDGATNPVFGHIYMLDRDFQPQEVED